MSPRLHHDLGSDGASDPAALAHRLRIGVGALVRATRSSDRMSPTAAAVLDLLGRLGPLTVADLAELRGVRHQSMAATVGELLETGHLERGPHPADGRKKLLALTKAGRDTLRLEATHREAALAGAIADALTPERRAALADGLDAIEELVAGLAGPDRASGTGEFVTGHW